MKKLLLSLFIIGVTVQPGLSQDYKFHSIFIYNFTKYIEWPDNYKEGNFVIGVLGKSSVLENLNAMAAVKTVGSQKIEVKEYGSVAEIDKCHILFIPQNESGSLDQALSKFESASTLVITERPGLGKKGSGINFVIEGGKWRFELNAGAIEKAKLKVSGELTKLAKVI